MRPPCDVRGECTSVRTHVRHPERAVARGPRRGGDGRGARDRRRDRSPARPRRRIGGPSRPRRERASPTPPSRSALVGGEALPFTNDVTDAFAVERTFDRVVDEWGSLDVLVNNAGLLREAPLDDLSEEDLQESLDVNLRGAMVCARAAVPHMAKRKHGRILSASSVTTWLGRRGLTAYSAAKAGVVGMTRTWARELGPLGITANVVAPGLIDSETVRSVRAGGARGDAAAHPGAPARPPGGGGRRIPLPRLRPRVLRQRRGRGRGRRPAAVLAASRWAGLPSRAGPMPGGSPAPRPSSGSPRACRASACPWPGRSPSSPARS